MILAACASPPRGVTVPRTTPSYEPPPKPEPAAAPAVQSDPIDRGSVVASAEGFLGTPYAYGGSGARGVDCSGLVLRVYAEHGVRLPRTSADQYRVGTSIERENLMPGDLVFFGAGGKASHVGIYAGRGAFIHASTSTLRVQRDQIDESYFRRRFLGARRILD